MSTPARAGVVVGIDGSREAYAALEFALTEARLRALPLRVVCAWEPSTSSYVGEAFAATPDAFLEAEHLAEEVLRIALAGLAGTDVPIEALAVEGRPAAVLVDQAAGAELVVVGSRGHGTTKRLLLGSVSTEVVHHAPCPVVIVPSPRADD